MSRFVFGVIIPHTILIGLSIRLAAKPQFDVMEVNETRVRMIAAVLLGTFGLIAHCIMCCRFALFNPNAAPLIIATLSLAAPLCGLVYWSSATATIRRRSKSLQTYSGELYREIRDIVDTATAQLGLKHNVQLRTWHTPNTPPCTLRALFRRPFLILPPNLSDILERLSKVTGIERQILFRFIVLHELSHLKNGDALFMPWARAFLETAKYFVPCLLISDIVVFAVYLESFKATLLGVSLVSISFGIPALVYLYVARHREHLADSRALLLISNRHAEALARPCVTVQGKPLSAVELLFTYFADAPTCDTAKRPRGWLAGHIGRLVLGMFRWRLGHFKARRHSKASRLEWNTHPKTEERVKVLRDRVFLQARRPYLSVSASIWVGVSSILLFLMFSLPAFAIVEVTEGTWLGSGPMELTKFVLLNWAFLAAVGYVVSMFLIPCRYMLAPLSSSAKDVLVTVSRFLLVAVSWVIVFALVCLPSLSSFVRAAPSLIALSLWPLGVFLLVLWLVVRTNTQNAEIRAERRWSTSIVGLEVLSYITFLVLLVMSQLVTIGPLVIAVLLAVLMGSTVLYSMPGKTEGSWAHRYASLRIGGVSRRFGGYSLWPFLVMTLGMFMLLILLPTMLFSVVLSLLFSKLELAFEFNAPYSPFIVLPLVFSLQLFVTVKYANVASRWERQMGHACVLHYAWCARFLGCQPSLSARTAALRYVESTQLPEGGFEPLRGLGLPQMNAVFQAVVAQKMLMPAFEPRSATVNWVLRCQSPEGGFGPWPGAKPRLCSTYEALSVLHLAGRLSEINANEHQVWILKRRCQGGGFSEPYGKVASLCDTFHALQGLKMLDICMDNLRDCQVSWVIKHWRSGRKDFASTFHYVMALDSLGALSPQVDSEIESVWLLPLLPTMLHVKPDRHIDKLYYYLAVVDKVWRTHSSPVEAIFADLPTRVGEAFRVFVERLEGRRPSVGPKERA